MYVTQAVIGQQAMQTWLCTFLRFLVLFYKTNGCFVFT